MTDKITIKPASIFDQCSVTSIAAMCAKRGFSLPQTHQVCEFWENAQYAHERLEVEKRCINEGLIWGDDDVEERILACNAMYEAQAKLKFVQRASWIDAEVNTAYGYAKALINALTLPALIAEDRATAMSIFDQFSAVDIAYAAQRAGKDVELLVDDWETFEASEGEGAGVKIARRLGLLK